MGDCHIRIYVTCDSDRNLLPDELGHFDIQFDIGGYTFNSHSFSNPVFSYGGEDGEQGYLRTFSPSRTAIVFSGKMFLALTYDFTASVSDMEDCISKIEGYMSTSSESKITSNAYEYEVNTGPFVTYTFKNRNCFHATAIFADWVGYSKLIEIYNTYTTDYTKYSAYNMYQKYYVSGGWTNHGYYNC